MKVNKMLMYYLKAVDKIAKGIPVPAKELNDRTLYGVSWGRGQIETEEDLKDLLKLVPAVHAINTLLLGEKPHEIYEKKNTGRRRMIS